MRGLLEPRFLVKNMLKTCRFASLGIINYGNPILAVCSLELTEPLSIISRCFDRAPEMVLNPPLLSTFPFVTVDLKRTFSCLNELRVENDEKSTTALVEGSMAPR
ncbi:hypothetical protein PoB_004772200 [Plakobranchus ocellatus]|uniref:Uncharacterized protein n=1 Tax=Plakobranchus ocellatus TaxID=259542 RepID=A0AAV4BPB6_9GAST|nr:hypothetical protein PoB_004772200 [Plakobranchus ocellatus]